MSKYLVLQVGKVYIKPFILHSEESLKRLMEESAHNTFRYYIYVYNARLDTFIPDRLIEQGVLYRHDGYLIKGFN